MAKWLSVRLWTKWFWVRVHLQSHKVINSQLNKLKSVTKTFAEVTLILFSANTKSSKALISKMIQSGGFLVDLAIGLLEVAFRTGIEATKRVTSTLPKNATNYFLNKK